jgi:hypothetical protein
LIVTDFLAKKATGVIVLRIEMLPESQQKFEAKILHDRFLELANQVEEFLVGVDEQGKPKNSAFIGRVAQFVIQAMGGRHG